MDWETYFTIWHEILKDKCFINYFIMKRIFIKTFYKLWKAFLLKLFTNCILFLAVGFVRLVLFASCDTFLGLYLGFGCLHGSLAERVAVS